MTEIYLIRHAQAEGNVYRMMQCLWDGNVTEQGRHQVAALGERFRDVHIDRVYSSPLYRAKYTASAISKPRALPIITDDRLLEISIGQWESEFFGNLIHRDPLAFRTFLTQPQSFSLPGAETFMGVAKRMMEVMTDIGEQNDGRTVAVVGHGAAMRCFFAAAFPGDESAICRNTGVNRIFYENGSFSYDYLDDVSHIDGEVGHTLQPSFNLREEYIDPALHREYYCRCYADAWRYAHGSLRGYNEDTYYRAALEHYEHDRRSVCIVYDGDEPVGLVDMDTEKGLHAGYGWISLLYLREDYRGKGLGVQLLARAIMKYDGMGLRAIRLNVSDDNASAVGFYKKWGFREISSMPGTAGGRLLIMERRLRCFEDV